jgi:peroxiredoxin
MAEVGQQAPDFSLQDQEGKETKLSDFNGKRLLLAFYPFDFSPVCTDEFKCFMDDHSELNGLGIEVLGISIDSKHCHREFAARYGIKFRLLADINKVACMAYGTLRKEGFSDRAYFLIDEHGVIRFRQVMPNPGVKMENTDLIKEIKKVKK